MVPSSKGKEKVTDGKGKRKRSNTSVDDDKTGDRKRKNRGVLQFFEDAACEVDGDESSDDSFLGDDFLDDAFGTGVQVPNEPGKASSIPFVPKEEQMTEEDFDKMMEERYKPGCSLITYAEDNYESKKSIHTSTFVPSAMDPIIWKVKCMVGRERHSAFCLMQKYVDLKYLGTKLQIISVFAVDHVKGFIYIEAERQNEIYEACKGLCNIYSSRVAPVPKDEISHLFSLRSKGNGVSEGMWARVKSGKYKGDLAQVVAVNDARKKVTVKLIPRIDLQAIAEKFGRGVTADKAVIPAPRLISTSELEEFRPLIQCRRDRDTNKIFQILDGLMLKDGYLFKKVSIDSLNFWGVTPTRDELLRFQPSENDEFKDSEWLSQLYGERKKRRPVINDKGSGKGEGSSSSSFENKFEVHDLVFFGRKEFGVIIGTEKDDSFKVIKEGSEGPVTVNVLLHELKNAAFDKKLFTALDQDMKNISINDTVRVLDGPLKDRQGVIKRIYRGIVFLYNEADEENNGYICIKAQMCKQVGSAGGLCSEKGGQPGSSSFGDFSSSPKSPLSPKRSQQGTDSSYNFKRDDDAMFSIGQSLRIRVGPLKGYLCRVLAVRRSDVTVKLDSQHKILIVKCEHLAEVRGKSSGISLGGDSDSAKPFNLLKGQDGSRDWMDGAAAATEGGNWDSGGLSTERSSWPAFPTSNFSLQQEHLSSIPPNSVDEDASKGKSSWEAKATPSQGLSWSAAQETVAMSEQVTGWGNQKKADSGTGFSNGASDSWTKAVECHHQNTGEGLKDDSWGQASLHKQTGGWCNAAGGSSGQPEANAWDKATTSGGSLDQHEANAWNKAKTANQDQTASWSSVKTAGEGTGGWGKDASMDGQSGGWKKNIGVNGSALDKQDGKTSWSKQGGGSSWSKPGGGSPWSKQDRDAGGPSTSDQAGGWRKGESDSGREQSDWGIKSSGWQTPKNAQEDSSSNWNKSLATNEEAGRPVGDGGGWEKRETPAENSKSVWNSSSSPISGSKSNWGSPKACQDDNSGWVQKSGGSKMDEEADNCGAWNNKKSSERVSSSGWGQSKWSGTNDAGGNQDSWGRKSNWNLENSFGGSEEQSEAYGDKGRGGGCRGGRGGRWGSGRGRFGSGMMAEEGGNTSAWNSNRSLEGGSSSGWGQNKWSGTTDTGGNHNSWGQKSNWKSENFGRNEEESDTSGGDKGRGGSWRGGGGGRWGSGRGRFGGSSKIDGAGDDGDAWNSKKSSEGNSSTGWGSKWSGKTDTGGNKDSWGQKSNWNSENNFGGSEEHTNSYGGDKGRDGSWRGGRGRWGSCSGGFGESQMDGEAEDGSTWNSKKSSEGASSSGWGQSKWRGTGNIGRNQDSWGNKSNWNSENNFGGSEEQTNTYGDKGRGGSWRGGLGGRNGSDRGGFGGRGHSDQGGFGGRGHSDRGGFGGRGRSDRGGFGGRGGSDRGGFRDRGGFGGRGWGRRDDWENKNDSGEDKPHSWKSMSNKDSNWSSDNGGGNWNSGASAKDKWQSGSSGWSLSEGAPGGGDSAQADGWNKIGSNEGGSDAKASNWNSGSKSSAEGWTGNSSGGGNWNSRGMGNNQRQGASSEWNRWKGPSVERGDDVQTTGWSKGLNLSKDDGANDTKPSGNSQENSWNTTNSSGGATSSTLNQPATGDSQGVGTVDAWSKAGGSSRSHPKDGNDKGGW